LANVLRTVLVDPRFRAQLNGGQMTVPEAVEQLLWDEPPFSTIFAYFAKQETELGGQRIRRGDGLLFAPAPANVDPRVRPDPTAHMQGNRSHLAFSGGPHECPGQDIGRAIAEIGVDALLMRLPDLELDVDDEDLRHAESIASRHLIELPVRFTPREPQDITERPNHDHRPAAPRRDWLIGSTEPVEPAAPPAARPDPFEHPGVPAPRPAATAGTPGAQSAEQPVAEPPLAEPPATEPPAAVGPEEPVRAPGAWQRFLNWWRGY
ncbi:cytochrome P450, partial [Streptomyces hirsutus]